MNSSFEIYIEELDRRIRFVDREAEIRYLLEIAVRGTVFPLAIYGPEGCGKTALLKRIAREVSEWSNFVVLYVDALEHFDIKRALFSSHRELVEIASSLVSIPIGESLARLLMRIVSIFAERVSLRSRSVVILIDDVYRAIGLENVDRYTKSLYEWVTHLHEEYGAANVAMILTTSEGVSKRELFRHRYVSVEMLWNLSRKGFEELIEQLEPPPSVDVEELWTLVGGNPRALIDLARLGWDSKRWLETIRRRVEYLVHDLDIERLRALVEDPDSDWSTAHMLEELNLMIYVVRGALTQNMPSPDPALGIGRYWAWQLPAYRTIVEKIVEERRRA